MRSWFEDNLAILRRTQPEAAAVLSEVGAAARNGFGEGFDEGFGDGYGEGIGDGLGDGLGGGLGGGLGRSAGPGPQARTRSAIAYRAGSQEGLSFVHDGCRAFLEPGAGPLPALALEGPGGRKRLSSALSPQREDRGLVDRFLAGSPPPREGLTLLGLGLGYHAEYVFEMLPEEAPLWLIEARPELAAAAIAARDMSVLLSRPGLVLRLGPSKSLPPKAPKAVLARPANLRLDPDLYPPLEGRHWQSSSLEGPPWPNPSLAAINPLSGAESRKAGSLEPDALAKRAIGPLSGHLPQDSINSPSLLKSSEAREAREAREASPRLSPVPEASRAKPKILFLDAGYFLSREIKLAASALGSEVAAWPVPSFGTAEEPDYLRLLATIKEFRPRLVLTVNHLGFDAEGLLASILKRLGIPAASWFVDSPAVILGGAELGPSSDLFVFSWDRDHLKVLSDFGFHKPAYLPLASSEAFFRAPPKLPKLRRGVAFVGDSLQAATCKYLSLAGLGQERLEAIDKLAESFLQGEELTAAKEAAELGERLSLSPERLVALEALITWRASRIARIRVLSLMPEGRLSVAGDEGWKGMISGAALLGRVDYYKGLRAFYQGTAVNLNITSAQMRGGLNQRVFDVPASKAFLLTDQKSQLEELFEPGAEVAAYANPLEAREMALWYLARPAERAKISDKAHRRAIGQHLYRHRLAELLKKTGLGGGS
jgi:spore maturation protein CgeB